MKIKQKLISVIFRPWIFAELPFWGILYKKFVGSYERDKHWMDAGSRIIKGKFHGYKMQLNLQWWSERSTFFLGRYFDLETQLLLTKILREGDCFFDIGANIGMMSLTASRIVGHSGMVHAVEPNPGCVNRIKETIKMNGIKNIVPYQTGLSDKKDSLTLVVPAINTGEGSFSLSKYDEQSTHNVEVVRGDDLLAEHCPHVVKIDVEGFEEKVITGLTSIVKRHKPIIITEIVKEHLERCGSNPGRIFNLMQTLGFRAFVLRLIRINFLRGHIHHDLKASEILSFADLEKSNDVVWVHPESEGWHRFLGSFQNQGRLKLSQ